ncbi:hypothetical protein DQ239_07985 [Blastococcus sp. TF02-09]|nr:hypothetical protein DQ239_07985 [Blastococcus sp. TF02-9]
MARGLRKAEMSRASREEHRRPARVGARGRGHPSLPSSTAADRGVCPRRKEPRPMTGSERQRLEDIESALRTESPDLARLLAGTGAPPATRESRRWRWSVAIAAVSALALLGAAALAHSAVLGVAGLVPPLTVAVLVTGERRWGRRR